MKKLLHVFLYLFSIPFFGIDPIGTVTAIEGNVTALKETSERVLEEGSKIFVLDTIITKEESRAQILFTDGAILNLIPATEFRVNTYKYKKILQKDQSQSQLLKGGLRLLSGAIAQKNPNEYEIQTPTATIGLRGTIINAVLYEDRLFVGVDQGRAIVTNSAGSVIIGVGERENFAFVPRFDLAPEVTITRPTELEMPIFRPPSNSLSIERESLTPPPARSPTPSAKESAPTAGTPAKTSDTSIQTSSESKEESAGQKKTGGGATIQSGC